MRVYIFEQKDTAYPVNLPPMTYNMKNSDAYKLLSGHGRVVCKVCDKVLISCRCITCGENIIKVICEDCEGKNE